MHTERPILLRNHLLGLEPDRFNMRQWFITQEGEDWADLANQGRTFRDLYEGECGTAACIAGHAAVLFSPDAGTDFISIIDHAAELLGLAPDQARALFIPETHLNATREQAVAVIDHLIETGEVQWTVSE